MCGIISAVSAERDISLVLLEGLSALEYRGYDSAGLSVRDDQGQIHRVRAAGKVAELEKRFRGERCTGLIGIAHTRWATHGAPTEANAHPHRAGDLSLVCNGILENHAELRAELEAEGCQFESDTDTETMAAYIDACVLRAGGDLRAGLRQARKQFKGSYALVLMTADGGELVGVTEGCPLVLGVGDKEAYLTSDTIALARVANRFVFFEDGDTVFVRADGYRIEDADGKALKRELVQREISLSQVDKGNYRHFTEKEIAEQPTVVREVLAGRLDRDSGRVIADSLGLSAEQMRQVRQVHLAACGSAYYAASVGAWWLEDLAGISAIAHLGSEYRSRRIVVPPETLFVAVSQSGETADTLAALKAAAGMGYLERLSVCNVPDSVMVRSAPASVLTRAGRELSVLSTKAVMAQMVTLLLLALEVGNRLDAEGGERRQQLGRDLLGLPDLLEQVLALDADIERQAHGFLDSRHALFLGRGQQFYIAAEGALKMKESAYIHAEAYAAGELKHGPLALVDEHMPVVALAPRVAGLMGKMTGNLQEVAARGGRLLIVESESNRTDAGLKGERIVLPDAGPEIGLMLELVAVQLLAYHVARLCGTDVDQPRNLAKSVTVE